MDRQNDTFSEKAIVVEVPKWAFELDTQLQTSLGVSTLTLIHNTIFVKCRYLFSILLQLFPFQITLFGFGFVLITLLSLINLIFAICICKMGCCKKERVGEMDTISINSI